MERTTPTPHKFVTRIHIIIKESPNLWGTKGQAHYAQIRGLHLLAGVSIGSHMRQKRLSIRAGVEVTYKWSALEPLTSPPHDPSSDTTLISYMMMPSSSYHAERD